MSGLAWAFSATLAACILMYAWVMLSASPVYYLGTLIITGTVLGAFAGGVAAGRAAQTLGILHGFLAGLGYGLLLLGLFVLGSKSGFTSVGIILRVLLLGLAGALGGLFGINLPFIVNRKPAVRIEKKYLQQQDLFFSRRS
jgi:putative membrane protein (TIGR04086 family)